jgi:hypothetical protein
MEVSGEHHFPPLYLKVKESPFNCQMGGWAATRTNIDAVVNRGILPQPKVSFL